MVVTLIIACEVGFWVLLALGLALRYWARMPRTSVAVLLCEPLLELVLLVATAVDLRNGAQPNWMHGLAAVYIGFTVTHGHYMIKWADGHVAHRFAGGPPPVRPPKYGRGRAVHEWKANGRIIGAAAIAAGLLQAAIWYVDDPEQAEPLLSWQHKMGVVAVVCLLIALSYTLWPPRPKDDRDGYRDGYRDGDRHSDGDSDREEGAGAARSERAEYPGDRAVVGGTAAPRAGRR